MMMEIPLYVEECVEKGETRYHVRPLFVPGISRTGSLLGRVIGTVTQDLRELFAKVGSEMRHDALLEWTFSPEIAAEVFEASLLLRHATVQCRLLLVMFEALAKGTDNARTVAFSPSVPHCWFELRRGEDLRTRASEALTGYFKALEKEQGGAFHWPETDGFARAWVTTAELHVSMTQKYTTPQSFLAALMGEEKMSGQRELQKVGRRLDALYPDALARAVLREAEVTELTRLLSHPDRRPVLLVGSPLVGKSTVLQEYIYRRRQAMAQAAEYGGSLWLISPQRLISGMMYAGQWENRLLAILDHLKESEQVLYLDDLPGMYHAGISAQSSLSAAQVLRPYIERRDVRVVAEITPASLRILQERDRGFADLFHLLPIREPSEADTRRTLLAVIREEEARHGTRFGIDTLPTVMELQGRYVRELAYPGKAALFLKEIAAKYEKSAVSRNEVLAEFHRKSGLALGMLDRRQTLERKDIEGPLRETVVGQGAAVAAMADAVGVAKAQLNDPSRPLGSFLFVGPTGVGKTQAAKALAKFLFGDADRLVRFDMNEYLDAYAAQRLVGTWGEPEGLLTSAVRRRPFCVILFDEIEKADPAVFDLLLQVLGEGRLSDALGRTADFANTIIIMTSNLGVREAGMRFGFGEASDADRAEVFRRAAQAFFRPEFYNRIDRIVPFEKLTREHTRTIANDLISNVLSREGLRQRRCMLAVSPAAMDRIVDAGFHPELGARALKRAIERQLTQPVAARLAAIEPGTPTLIDVFTEGEGIGVRVRGLPYAERLEPPDVSDAERTIAAIDASMDGLHETIGELRPRGRITVGAVAPEHVRYFALKEQFDKIERLLERFERGEAAPRKLPVRTGPGRPSQDSLRRSRVNFRALLAAHDLRQHLLDLAFSATPAAVNREERLHDILRELALLQAMARSRRGRVAFVLRRLGGAGVGPLHHVVQVFRFFSQLRWNGQDLTRELRSHSARHPVLKDAVVWLVEHPAAEVLAQTERGVHLVIGNAQELYPIGVEPLPLEDGEDALQRIIAWAAEIDRDGPSCAENDERILRIIHRDVVDLRSGLIAPALDAGGRDLSKTTGGIPPYEAMLLAALPLELEA